MELKEKEQKEYQEKVDVFQKEINELSTKHGLFLVPTILYKETGIFPSISIVPTPEKPIEPIVK